MLLSQLHRFRLATVRERRVAAQARDFGEFSQHVTEEKAEPYAFAFAVPADQIHAVVPVAGTHQRQSVRAESQAVQMARTQCS